MKNTSWIIGALFLAACQEVGPCEKAKEFFLGKETNLVIQDKGIVGNVLDIKGYEPETKRNIRYQDTHGLYVFIRDSTELGDTLLKHKNETWFLLKKKKYNIKFGMSCNGNEYLQTMPERLEKNVLPKND